VQDLVLAFQPEYLSLSVVVVLMESHFRHCHRI
jgi:hypothetical protein